MELKFTGERVVPGHTPAWIEAHHVERYKFAASYCEGKEVADIGCGSGYGARILLESGEAESVTGFDLDPHAISFATEQFGDLRAKFLVLDILTTDIPREFLGRFDLLVAFEVIEHVTRPAAFLDAMKQFLRADGLMLISTPDRRLNSPGAPPWREPKNPFHVHEFTSREFSSLLTREFDVLERFGQCLVSRFITLIAPDWAHDRLEEFFSRPGGANVRSPSLLQIPHTMVWVCRRKEDVASERTLLDSLRAFLWHLPFTRVLRRHSFRASSASRQLKQISTT